MQRFAILFFLASTLGLGLFQACSSENDTTQGATSATASVGPSTGSGTPACNGNLPDGVCNLLSAAPETCECPDCAQTAGCTGKCADDGNCNLAGGEDCTCKDCYGKVTECMFGADQSAAVTTASSSGSGGNGGSTTSNGGASSSTTTGNGGGGAGGA